MQVGHLVDGEAAVSAAHGQVGCGGEGWWRRRQAATGQASEHQRRAPARGERVQRRARTLL